MLHLAVTNVQLAAPRDVADPVLTMHVGPAVPLFL